MFAIRKKGASLDVYYALKFFLSLGSFQHSELSVIIVTKVSSVCLSSVYAAVVWIDVAVSMSSALKAFSRFSFGEIFV